MQTQDFNNKNSSCFKKSKPKKLKSALSYNDVVVKPAKKKDKKDKKKRFYEQKRKYTREPKKQTLATNVNVIKAILKKKLKVRCFNYNKKSNDIKNCIKSLKN